MTMLWVVFTLSCLVAAAFCLVEFIDEWRRWRLDVAEDRFLREREQELW